MGNRISGGVAEMAGSIPSPLADQDYKTNAVLVYEWAFPVE
ncbi:MAG: hypothetical protein NTV43_13685 [Methylococcales bacterium]|nr:hypothetical protein [Methylococcales bacterium]